MAKTYDSPDFREYKMIWWGDPHPVMEPPENEVAEIDKALHYLVDSGVLPHPRYEKERFLAHREAVKSNFDIPWTGISPRMQRLLYAINAVRRPSIMVAVGVFCGNTFISNAGAALGPGAVYQANRLVGIEIDKHEAERAKSNVRTIDSSGTAEIVAGDGITWLEEYDNAGRGPIDLLYIDADGAYLPLIKAAASGPLSSGGLVLAHNSVNMEGALGPYLDFVRDPKNSKESVNMRIDDQGLEVTLWKSDT